MPTSNEKKMLSSNEALKELMEIEIALVHVVICLYIVWYVYLVKYLKLERYIIFSDIASI